MFIKEIEILSDDLTSTWQFYDEILGLEIFENSDDRISFKIGESILTFTKSLNQKPIYHYAITIPCNKITEALTWLQDKVQLIKLNNEHIVDFPNWNAKSVYFYDNNGNIMEFIARFDLNNASAMPFSSSSFLSISEIAMVTANVEGLAKQLIENNDLHYFYKQKQKGDFSVIGDDNGLLILSSSERNWFPTNSKAVKFPTKILLDNKDRLIEIKHE